VLQRNVTCGETVYGRGETGCASDGRCRVAVCCSVLQCVAVCCSVLQRVVVYRTKNLPTVKHHMAEGRQGARLIGAVVLQCVAVCCSALQRVAVYCREILPTVKQHMAIGRHGARLSGAVAPRTQSVMRRKKQKT
jgi:hypothetical protein